MVLDMRRRRIISAAVIAAILVSLTYIFAVIYEIVPRGYIDSVREEARNRYIAYLISYDVGKIEAYTDQLYSLAVMGYGFLSENQSASIYRVIETCDKIVNNIQEAYKHVESISVSADTEFFRKYLNATKRLVDDLIVSYRAYRENIMKGDLYGTREALSNISRIKDELVLTVSSIIAPYPLK